MKGSTSYRFRYAVAMWSLLLVAQALLWPAITSAQQIRVARIQPDAMASGMTVTLEILAPATDSGAFGADGIYMPSERLAYNNAADSIHVIFGPVSVSWNGRVMQVPVIATRIAGAAYQGDINFYVVIGNRKSALQTLSLVSPQTSINLVGSGILGQNGLGALTHGNTMVVDSIVLSGQAPNGFDHFSFDLQNPDTTAANVRYHPMTILALHGVRFTNMTLSVSADGPNGGPGGGGGGGGFISSGGFGYSGGGSDSLLSNLNNGSGAGASETFGGASSTGVLGGASSGFVGNNADQGGGGGTGCPYGSSGIYSGGNEPSLSGGFGGASAGGETPGQVYGGGGGSFATEGTSGVGVGSNQGRRYGGRFLIPMMGGSGGGSGNAQQDTIGSTGSGGGGGGAVTIISFENISISQSTIASFGASGTSGRLRRESGGGAGSGGGIYLAARHGVVLDQAKLDTRGGSGGLGGTQGDTLTQQGGRGGDGGLGALRIDGRYNDTCSDCRLNGILSNGPIIIPADSQLRGPSNLVGGISGSKTELLDSIRIYYRNHHSPWQMLDTVRDATGSQPSWSARINLGYDSLLFVVVYEKVSQPHSDTADLEPQWLTGHLASAVIRVIPTPHPVVYSDTLDFGCTIYTDSVTAPMYVTDLGEAPFIIDTITISDPIHFVVVSNTSVFDGYHADSILVRYLPQSGPRRDTATLRLISKTDTIVVTLVGCSIDKDERLQLSLKGLNFHAVHVGDCPSAFFTVKSIGADPILVRCSNIVSPPFQVISPTHDTLLAPGQSITITVQFCPQDSGVFHSTMMLSDRRDSVSLDGIGLIRLLKPQVLAIGNILCPNQCDSIRLVLHSNGNQAVRIDSLSGATMISPRLPLTIAGRTDTEIVVQYCNTGSNQDTIIYFSNADTSSNTIITLTPLHISFAVSGRTALGPLCLSKADSSVISIINTGTDSLFFDSVQTPAGVLSATASTNHSADTLTLSLHYHPSTSGLSTDHIVVYTHSGSCDSIFTIDVSGVANSLSPQYSTPNLDFGTLDSGACTDSSIRISLPCGSDTITISGIRAPFELLQPVDGILILSGDTSANIILRYCAGAVGRDSLELRASDRSDTTMLTLVATSGSVTPPPVLHFTMQRVAVQAGTPFTYTISIDTALNVEAVDSVHAIIRYDPLLLEANSASSPFWSLTGVESKPGKFEIFAHGQSTLVPGRFVEIRMLPFLAAKNNTNVVLSSIETFTSSLNGSDSGNVVVADCSNLSGNVIVAGPYQIDRIVANPVSTSLDLDVTIGATAAIGLRILDLSGATVLVKNTTQLQRGKHHLTIDVSSLPSGVYRAMLESLGWNAGTTFIVQH